MSGKSAKPDLVLQEFIHQASRWWQSWRWWLIAMLALVWVPVFVDLIHDLWMLSRCRDEAFLGLPDEFFNDYAGWAPSLYQLNINFVYYTPPLRRLLAFAAALGLAGYFRLTPQLVEARAGAELYQQYRGAVRRAIYTWMGLGLLGPALFSMVLFYGDYQLSTARLHWMLGPALLLLADWVSLCEMQVLMVVRRIGPNASWRLAIVAVIGGIFLLFNYYTPIVFDLRADTAPAWLAAAVNIGLTGISVVLALLWWYLTLRMPAGFPQNYAGHITAKPAAAAATSQPVPTRRGTFWRGRRLKYSAIAGMLLLIGGIIWLQVMRSGVLYDPDCYPDPDFSIPVISTRDSCERGKLIAAHSGYEYRIEGELPGWSSGSAAPADLLIVIHGFNNDERHARYKFDLAQDTLAANGYTGALAGWSWDADTQRDPLGTTGYHSADEHAKLNGRMLAQFAVDYKAACPGTRLHVLGYSMGARTALEALKALAEDPRFAAGNCKLDTVHLFGAAVDNEEAELGKSYGRAIESRAGLLFNYYSLEDNALAGFYGFKQLDLSLGQGGIEHSERTPINYVAVDAAQELKTFDESGNLVPNTLGDNHKGYLGIKNIQGELIDDGAMNLVAAYIHAAGELDRTTAGLDEIHQLLRDRQ